MPLGDGPFGESYAGSDASGGNVLIRRVRRDLVARPDARGRLHAEITRASSLEHHNILKPLEFIETGKDVAVVSQWIQGESLRAFLTTRAGPLPFADAAGVILNICAALVHAAPITSCHGALLAGSVFLQSGGRIKVGDFGFARALPLRADAVSASDRHAVSPEHPNVDARSDVYALGALLFELTTGSPPTPGLLPRHVNVNLPSDLDALITVMLARAPEERLPDAASVGKALSRLVSAEHTAARLARERDASRVSKQMAAHRQKTNKKSGKVRVREDEPRWLLHREKLDYGPYTLVELKVKIGAHEIVPGDIIIDQELGKRAEVEAHPLLHDLVSEAARQRHAHGEAAAVASESKRGAALYGFIAAGALALIGGGYGLVRVLGAGSSEVAHRQDRLSIEVANIGGIRVGTAKHTDDREAQRRHRAAVASAKPAGAGGKGDAWDDSTSFDMAGKDVGDERLDDAQINVVIGKNAAGLARCLRGEAERGGARNADIEFVILGSGKVAHARVNGESGTSLASCVRGALQAMAFPPFNGPRTKASFSMGL